LALKHYNDKFTNYNFKVFYLVFVLLIFVASAIPAWGYPIDGTTGDYSNLGLDQARKLNTSVNELIRSFLGPGLSFFSSFKFNEGFGSGLNQLVPGGTGLSFDDFINIKSFSAGDISGSIKAVAILFIKIVITTLATTIGILKLILNLILSN